MPLDHRFNDIDRFIKNKGRIEKNLHSLINLMQFKFPFSVLPFLANK